MKSIFSGAHFCHNDKQLSKLSVHAVTGCPNKDEQWEWCHSLRVQQKMPVVCWCSLFHFCVKATDFTPHLLPAGSDLFNPAVRQSTDYWKLSLQTMKPKDDKLHRWWINVTIRSLIHPSLAEQKVGLNCDKSEWLGSPLARFWVLKCVSFAKQLKVQIGEYRRHWFEMNVSLIILH